MIENTKAVIFDMDGVLLDTESMCDKIWMEAAPSFAMSCGSAMKALSYCRGRNKQDTITYLQSAFNGLDAEAFFECVTQSFHIMEEKDGIPLMKGALLALRRLREGGYRLALASSTQGDTVKRQLGNAGLLDYFETLTTGEMVTHSKPEGQIYALAAASLSLPPALCVAIEDSPNGVKSAAAAHMRCIMIPDREKATAKIKRLAWKVLPSLEEIESVL